MVNMLRILVVDDDLATALYLKQIIEEAPNAIVVAVAMNRQEAIQKAREYKPQAVFLDINMPGMSGLELARALMQRHDDILIVFASAYSEYALSAYEFYPFDYILKPLNEERVKRTVHKLKERLRNAQLANQVPEGRIVIEYRRKQILLKPEEILFVESCKPQIHIKTKEDDFLIKGSFPTLKEELLKHGFFQSHRSYLINLEHISQIVQLGYTYEIVLDTNDRVMLSRQHAKRLRKILNK